MSTLVAWVVILLVFVPVVITLWAIALMLLRDLPRRLDESVAFRLNFRVAWRLVVRDLALVALEGENEMSDAELGSRWFGRRRK